MSPISARAKALAAGAALIVPALYFKHAVRFQNKEIPIDTVEDHSNGFDYYRFNSLTGARRTIRAHWHVDTPILEPYAAEHYDDVKKEIDEATAFNRTSYMGHVAGEPGILEVCDVNSYGYSIYPILSPMVFDFMKSKPFFQQHTHTNIARGVCEPKTFAGDSGVWTSTPAPNSLWFYTGDWG